MKNLSAWLMVLLWWIEETRYFGWNQFPQSVPELFADGLGAAMMVFILVLGPDRSCN